jgi:hypothetical protein
VKSYSYDDMIASEVDFFFELISFLRGGAIEDSERGLIERACLLTGRNWARRAERELGHSLSFIDGLEKVFRSDTHMTDELVDHLDIRGVRMAVKAKVLRHQDKILPRFRKIMLDLQNSEV